jgi:hypothetical protein
MDIFPIRVVRAQCCAYLLRLRGGARLPEQCRQGANRGKVDIRRNRDAPVRAGQSIKHPRRNLQPPVQWLARKGAAEDRRVTLLDHFMDKDLPLSPGMPWIKKLALNTGPVGVPSLSCIIIVGPTRAAT